MSFITRCPNCQTLFKVLPDQLKASQGWVRCGQCEQVFDATANMQDAPAEPDAQHEGSWPEWNKGPAPDFDRAPHLGHEEPLPEDDLQLETPDASAWREPYFEPPPNPRPAAPAAFKAVPELPPETALHDDGGDADGFDGPRQGHENHGEHGDHDAHQHLSFLRRSRWQRPWVHWTLVLSSVVLTLALAVQVVLHERDRIAAYEPRLHPLLQGLCGCAVQPLRQIDSVVIDGSAFSKIRDELYQLNLTLRNKAPVDLAMPSIELTLTDVQDQTLIRRVLTPQELGAGSNGTPSGTRKLGAYSLIRASDDFQASVQVAVTGGLDARVAGYRLLAFYP
jgi:predicted Zn finger-like uncharacterized protein